MQVLAKRSNVAFIGTFVTAVSIIAWFVVCDYIRKNIDLERYAERFLVALFIVLLFLFVLFFVTSVKNLTSPKIIIECDDKGLYIYRNFKDTIILRYEKILSQTSEQDFNMLVLPFNRLYSHRPIIIENVFYSDKFPGDLRIETPDGFISIYGVAQVKKVESDISDILRQKRREYAEKTEKISGNRGD